MKLSLFGRIALAAFASFALGLGMSACGGGTIAYIWVPGQQYNQIVGFKVDDYTGNLTQSPGSPYGGGGVNPIDILVTPTGRYVFVINQGSGGNPGACTGTSAPCRATSSGVDLYSVGNDGVLSYQQHYDSQGFVPVWAQFDSTGSYLFVLDRYSPAATACTAAGVATPACFGSYTVYQIDGGTGRLTLVQNNQVTPGTSITYFNVGTNPIMSKSIGNCLFTLDSTTNTVYPYQIGGGGQLLTVSNAGGSIIINNAVQLTSINGGGSTVYLTDANNGSATNYIIPEQVTAGCNLSLLTGGEVANFTGTANPAYSLLDNSGKFLYVLNQSDTSGTPGTTPNSTISAFSLLPGTGQLQQIAGAPYTVGTDPVCIVEDPTNQYLYISNHDSGTITGKYIDSTTGELSSLTRGSTFAATGDLSCIALSGNVNY